MMTITLVMVMTVIVVMLELELRGNCVDDYTSFVAFYCVGCRCCWASWQT